MLKPSKLVPTFLLAASVSSSVLAGQIPRAVSPTRRTTQSHRLAPHLTLARLADLESEIIRLHYELEIARLRAEIAHYRNRSHTSTLLPIQDLPSIFPPKKKIRVQSDWTILSIQGHGHNLRAILRNQRGQLRSVRRGSFLGRAQVVRVGSRAVWIRDHHHTHVITIQLCPQQTICSHHRRMSR